MVDRNNAMTEAPRNAGGEEIRELTGDELGSVSGGWDVIDLLKKAAKFAWDKLGPR